MFAFDVASDDEGEVEVVWVELFGGCWVCHFFPLVFVLGVDCGLDVFVGECFLDVGDDFLGECFVVLGVCEEHDVEECVDCCCEYFVVGGVGVACFEGGVDGVVFCVDVDSCGEGVGWMWGCHCVSFLCLVC